MFNESGCAVAMVQYIVKLMHLSMRLFCIHGRFFCIHGLTITRRTLNDPFTVKKRKKRWFEYFLMSLKNVTCNIRLELL